MKLAAATLVATIPALAAYPASDRFGRASGNLGAASCAYTGDCWTQTNTADSIEVDVNSKQARGQTGNTNRYGAAYWNGDGLPNANQYSKAIYGSSYIRTGVGVRIQATGTRYYSAWVKSEDTKLHLSRHDTSATFTDIATATACTPSAGDVIEIKAEGSAITGTVFQGTTATPRCGPLSATDTTYTTGYVGITVYSTSAGLLDSWVGGNIDDGVYSYSDLTSGDVFVATTGKPVAAGSSSDPFSPYQFLYDPPSGLAGKYVWVRAGTYQNQFISYLEGTAGNQITYRQYPGELVRLDGNIGGTTEALTVYSDYVTYWGFLIASSYAGTRYYDNTSVGPTNFGVDLHGKGATGTSEATDVNFVHSVVRDNNDGIASWDAHNGTIYGNVVFNNGWLSSSRGHGHAHYCQHATGPLRTLENNINGNGFGWGIHCYTESGTVEDITVNQHIGFNHRKADGRNDSTLYMTGSSGTPATGLNVTNGSFFAQASEIATNAVPANLGAEGTTTFDTFTGNYLAGAVYYWSLRETGGATTYVTTTSTITGNTFIGAAHQDATAPRNAGANTYLANFAAASGQVIRCNASTYEQGRIHCAVFNWSGGTTAAVNLSTYGFNIGDPYCVIDVQNYGEDEKGTCHASGTYAGGSITITLPGSSSAVQKPTGAITDVPYFNTMAHTSSQFNAFVIRREQTYYIRSFSAFNSHPAATQLTVEISPWSDMSHRYPATTFQVAHGSGTGRQQIPCLQKGTVYQRLVWKNSAGTAVATSAPTPVVSD